ncbi:glycosyltransferase family 2 protein [Flavobacterium sp. CLA17]|uniref:glycosyltransferase family 2 protein n=1 Tax=Flavobacterium sp. CLA17 TaxID=2724135 RepID=UPI0014921084|nr:glycosyltransferase family 2 protein [Flavobacterium sp. CLA17]QSB27986.1 glycosyltransferase family 2 protein [Flavobacterium sp. CLA17]
MSKPSLSLIIPVFNRSHLIEETLNSILSQSFTDWECIIVDDHSTDATWETISAFIKKDDRFKLYRRPENLVKGANSCRNFGFLKSKGDFVNWFDSDDIYLPNAFEEFSRHFNPDLDAVIYKLNFVALETGNFLKQNKIQSDTTIEDYLVGNIAFYVSGPVWNRNFLLNQEMLFDPEIKNLDDWDFNLRMLYADPKLTYMDSSYVLYRIHAESLSHELAKLNYEEILSEFNAREKHLKLIKNRKQYNRLKLFIKERHHYFYKIAMIDNNKKKYYFFKELQLKQIELLDLKAVISTTFGFILYIVFKKGYKFL